MLHAVFAEHDIAAAKGLVFPLVAAFGWAAGTVYLKRWPVAGNRIVVTAWQLVVGASCALAGALIAGESFPMRGWTASVAGALSFHIILGTAVAYWLWFVLSERVSATVAALTTLMVPVVGVLGAMALVGDRPGAADWWGFAFVLAGAGLIVLNLGQRRG
ncbi:putative inner membrane transporter yiJE [compost metagenome]